MSSVKDTATFQGFSQTTLDYLHNLYENNSREWFHSNKNIQDNYYLKESYAFIETMGTELSKEVPGINYEAKVNRSLYRLNRDTRFSKNKHLYKNNIGILFWKGPYTNRNLNPGFYFHLEPQKMILAVGTYFFEPEILSEYRSSLKNSKYASQLLSIAEQLGKNGICVDSMQDKLKRPPSGFDKDSPVAEFAKCKSLGIVSEEMGLIDIVYRKELIDYCMAFFSKGVPLLEWLADMTHRAANSSKKQ